ncbi:hypothetical protein [Amycolatopsis sp. H20-H5]|uniref:hypothetical protein n=1 Tax=Amycolatopsis sp. H20-H5 TaxID=3046309 RepID=UPI003FA34813
MTTTDIHLPVWIVAAMLVGLLAGRAIPGLNAALNAVSVDGISLPIAIGLLVMMYPARYRRRQLRNDRAGPDDLERRDVVLLERRRSEVGTPERRSSTIGGWAAGSTASSTPSSATSPPRARRTSDGACPARAAGTRSSKTS